MTDTVDELALRFNMQPHADLAKTILEHCARFDVPALPIVLRWAFSYENWDVLPTYATRQQPPKTQTRRMRKGIL